MASSTFLGSKMLTSEQADLVASMTASSLFGDEVSEVALQIAESKRYKTKEKEILQPYADAFLEHLKERVTRYRDDYFMALSTQGYCDIDDYLAIFYNQTLLERNRAYASGAYEEEPTCAESTLGIMTWMKEDDDYIQTSLHYPIKIHRIVRSSDFLTRVAMLFGPKFVASLNYHEIEKKEGQWGWTQTSVAIRVTYKGDRVPLYETNLMLKSLEENKGRVPFTLGNKNWLYGDCFHEKPLPKPVALLGSPVARHLFL